MTLRILDLYCGAGGAGKGYSLAGFHVTGVDMEPQPRYPFAFIQADALKLDVRFLRSFDAIHASPPRQAHTALGTMPNAKEHADLIPATRAMLVAAGVPWIMENVVGAPLIDAVTLCGTMFGLGAANAQLRRHRLFEASFQISAPRACQHFGATIGVYGGHVRDRRCRADSADRGVADPSFADGCAAMGIDWMTLAELSQSIPPAYTNFLGSQMIGQLGARVAA